MKPWRHEWLLAGVLLLPAMAGAEPAYIASPTIAVHTQIFEQGTVVKTLGVGTRVEVLVNNGDYSQVRTSDNVVGWIASRHLTTIAPALPDYAALEARYNAINAELSRTRAQLASGAAPTTDSRVNTLQAELDKLKAANQKLEANLKDQEQKSLARIRQLETATQTRKEMNENEQQELESLRVKNQDLEQRLGAVLLLNEDSRDALDQNESGWRVGIIGLLIAIAVALIAGAGAGVYWFDQRLRKRHGGFRIY